MDRMVRPVLNDLSRRFQRQETILICKMVLYAIGFSLADGPCGVRDYRAQAKLGIRGQAFKQAVLTGCTLSHNTK